MDILPRIRQMAQNRYEHHPWKAMSDIEVLQSAGLIGEDMETGKKGYNLAAVMLLGRDEVIRSVVPAYRTDALVRKINLDRYDDRLIVETNLIDSYELLMNFAEKHLWDKFYLEGDARISLRSAISREMLVNTLIHREFTSPYIAKFVIENNRMYTENANRAVTGRAISLENFEPNPKNPIIASFFRNIGLADELGSGVRNLYYYGKRYSGKDPELIDGDIFRIIVPLNDNYSFGGGPGEAFLREFAARYGEKFGENFGENRTKNKIIVAIQENPKTSAKSMAKQLGITTRAVEKNLSSLKADGIIERIGPAKGGYWVVKQ